MADTVVHDTAGSRFVLERDGKQIGETVYETRDGVLTFVHTGIDEELQERGLGSKLVGGALDQLRSDSDVRVGATCPFVVRYLSEHPEYEELTTR